VESDMARPGTGAIKEVPVPHPPTATTAPTRIGAFVTVATDPHL